MIPYRSSHGGQSLEIFQALGCREGRFRQLSQDLRMATNVPWAACEKLALEEFLGWTLGGHGAKPLKHEALLVDPADQ